MLKPGTVVDRYVIEERIGEGGMAVVYRVRHTTLGSRHALKVLTITSADVVERLVQEGKVQASLQHPNVVSVSDVLEVNGAPGLVMEFIQGPALDHWLYNYTPTLEEALIIFRGIVAGVGSAHAKGILHRDLKPANILLHVDERGVHPKVTDFGLAKLTHATNQRQTRTGTTMGTPQYMAPEQIRDASTVDRRADLYSLGVILYELVCGEPPYADGDVIELFTKVAAGDHRHPRDLHSTLPDQVVECIEGLMEVNLAHRFTDCASILEVLDGADASAFTTSFDLTAGKDLAPARAMPANPGPTSLVPTMAGAAIAKRWIKQLISVKPVERAASVPGDDDDSGLHIDLRTPTPPPPTPVEGSGKRWGTRLIVILLLLLVGLLGTALVTTLGVIATQLDDVPTAADTDVPVPDPVPTTPPPGPDLQPPPEPAAPQPAAPQPAPPQPVEVAPTPAPVVPVAEPTAPAPVVPKPPPVAPEPVVSKATTGSFSVVKTPDLEFISLTAGSLTFTEGQPIPPGTYTIRGRFSGGSAGNLGSATVTAGKTTQIVCITEMNRCKAN